MTRVLRGIAELGLALLALYLFTRWIGARFSDAQIIAYGLGSLIFLRKLWLNHSDFHAANTFFGFILTAAGIAHLAISPQRPELVPFMFIGALILSPSLIIFAFVYAGKQAYALRQNQRSERR